LTDQGLFIQKKKHRIVFGIGMMIEDQMHGQEKSLFFLKMCHDQVKTQFFLGLSDFF